MVTPQIARRESLSPRASRAMTVRSLTATMRLRRLMMRMRSFSGRIASLNSVSSLLTTDVGRDVLPGIFSSFLPITPRGGSSGCLAAFAQPRCYPFRDLNLRLVAAKLLQANEIRGLCVRSCCQADSHLQYRAVMTICQEAKIDEEDEIAAIVARVVGDEAEFWALLERIERAATGQEVTRV